MKKHLMSISILPRTRSGSMVGRALLPAASSLSRMSAKARSIESKRRDRYKPVDAKALKRIAARAAKYLGVPDKQLPTVSYCRKRPGWTKELFVGGQVVFGSAWVGGQTRPKIWINPTACQQGNVHPVRVLMHEVKHIHNHCGVMDEWDEGTAKIWESVLFDLWDNGGI